MALPWKVQSMARPNGRYYTAIHRDTKRSVTVGYLEGDPAPALLVQRLMAHPDAPNLPDQELRELLKAPIAPTERWELDMHKLLRGMDAPLPAPKAPEDGPKMSLADYIEKVWGPHRNTQVTPKTWRDERWCWDHRILPALGRVRLCDLNAARWNAFMDHLKGLGRKGDNDEWRIPPGRELSPRTKTMTRNAYRVALAYAVEELQWLPEVHKMASIKGAKKRTLPDPEPLSIDEINTFLAATPTPMHRAMFATQIGQGLRPGEVIRVRWEDVDWHGQTIFIRGTKTATSGARVPMSPLTVRELEAYWHRLGEPSEGVAFERTKGRGDHHAKKIRGVSVGGGAFPKYPTREWHRTAEKSGLNESRTRALFPYVARHTFATLAAELGIDRAHAKKMMRHTTTSTVMEDAYIKVSMKSTAAAFQVFDVPPEDQEQAAK